MKRRHSRTPPLNSGAMNSSGRPRSYLTDRERELCLLLIQGMTNQMIADELAISTETVKRHMTNIFDVTGMDNRTALAVWVLDHPEVFKVNETGC